MRTLLCFLFLSSSIILQAQETFPSNGAPIKDDRLHVLKGATVYVDPVTIKANADVFIRNGRVLKVSQGDNIPRNAVVHDMSRKYIYPAFIELYSQYGLPERKKESSSGPVYERGESGALAWHASVRPENYSAILFEQKSKDAEELRRAGFGTVLTHQIDGVIRGPATLALLSDERNNLSLIKEKAAMFFSFDKGVTAQAYARSKMGAIALIRQTLYDAEWYANSKVRRELNLSLEALNEQKGLPRFLVTEEKNDILRGKKIADEFGFRWAYVGSGNEYERIQDVKSAGALVILPLTFPEAMDMSDPYTSRAVPLRDLRHWELAPANAAYLSGAGVPIAITMHGSKDAGSFWKNLRKARAEGLSESQVLAALTTEPASAIGMQEELGTLRNGAFANLLILDGPLMEESSQILENWVHGKAFIMNNTPTAEISGEYDMNVFGRKMLLTVQDGDKAMVQAERSTDTSKVKVDFKVMDRQVNLSFVLKDQGLYRLHGTMNSRMNLWEGKGVDPEGKEIAWNALKKKEGEDRVKKIQEQAKDRKARLKYPNHGQGWSEAPRPQNVVFRNATVWTNTDQGVMKDADVVVRDGKIAAVGYNLSIENVFPKERNRPEFKKIEAYGKHITCGIIDEHSHIAISRGVNEGGQASSAEVRIGDVIDPEDIDIYYQLAGGVTASQLLHGSANPIGGQSALIKLRWGSNAEELKIEGADGFIKFALGENVKQSNWGDEYRVRFPQTRMGVEQVYFDHFYRAREYSKANRTYNNYSEKDRRKSSILSPPRRDLELDALAEILESKRFITCHSYVQSEINMLMHMADSMGFRVNTFTHILEGYKVADLMKAHGAGASTFSDWWAYKFEVREATPYNAALMNEMGLTVAINSDDAEMGRRLNQEAAKGVKYGGMSEEDAWKMVTLNPAKLLHLDHRMGSVASGIDADLVVWSDNPLSIYAKVEKTFVDGILYYDREEDMERMLEISKERNDIVRKMMEDKASPKRPASHPEKLRYHCDHEGH